MTREEKAQIIEELSEKFANNAHFYITDAGGFTVAQINSFRRMCFKSGIEYKVYKNTLIRKALERQEGNDYSPLFTALEGFSGVLFSKEAGNLPAKVIREFRTKLDGKPVLKAASINSDLFIGDENLIMLSELKSKNELIGDVIAMLQAPAQNLISALQSGKNTVAGLVKALEERGSK
ncbi:50S ribosomal protein L10 [Ohtaekwangia koreensis]|jgi:large subunit ribosomal protein L10|uniref:Large ribosomal subunit protein uL10 n=1 Tax=Ohtaekwangia koreensis TaxID=688867 RepID=A0A1T5LRT7_9BACT|nr:50S ribosomal protein L10 [Ohtaekwangia koreensis]SKC78575.1 large subunit ribosomal protein L10 [Ohtaekwangia koreensis]